MEKREKKKIYTVFKRIIDLIVAITAGILLILPCLVFALIIKFESKGPVLFKQKRVGKGKKHFTIYKFRTMRTDAPHEMPTHLLSSAQSYITKSGAFMRKTSIDEIPQLLNIIKGDMSFVGPRPALWNQYDLIEERDKYGANDVVPGLTGWAQINGRDDIPIDKKAELDGEYVRKQSFFFDLKIFFGTFSAALTGKNVTDSKAEKNNEKLNILVVCQYFYPEAFRVNDICQELIKKGHNVTVLTGTPNYPGGKIFQGYEKGKKKYEVVDGIEIYRTKIVPRGNGNSVRMVLNYYSFLFNGKRMARKLAKKKQFDSVFVYQLSPALMALPGLKVAKKQNIPMIMYILDLWPDSVVEAGHVKNKLILGLLKKKLNKIYSFCSKIFVSSRSFKKILVERDKCSEEKIIYWPQYPEDYYLPCRKEKENDKFNIMFTGNVGKAQGMDIVVDAALEIKDDDIHWTIVGDGRGKKDLEEKIIQNHLEDKITLIRHIPSQDVPKMLAKADAALMVLKDMPLANITMPAKIQSYLACGMPILASINGEGAMAVTESKAGLVSPAGDAKALAENALKMKAMSEEELKKLSDNAVEYCNKEYNKDKLIDILIEETGKIV